MYQKILSMAFLLCIFSFPAVQVNAETIFTNDPIVITASRYETSVSKEGKDISVITEDDIKKSGKKNLSDVLESIPGVTVTRSGADEGLSKVYIRGGRSSNVLIMIDGVRISDPIGIEKLYDISGIKTFNIERIEVVRGAMSAMYGAEASGGVINIITKKGSGKRTSAAVEAGSNRTFTESFSVSDSTEQSSFIFSASHTISDGISRAKENAAISSYDDDGYQNIMVSGRMDTKLSDKASMAFTMNYTGSDQDSDDGSNQDDPNHRYSSKLFTSRGELRHTPAPWWGYRCGISYMSYIRTDIDQSDYIDSAENDSFTYNGSNANFDLINTFNISDYNTLTVGAELLREKGGSASNYGIAGEISVDTKSVFINDSVSVGKILSLNAGGRSDTHDAFGTHLTWDTSAAFIIPVVDTKLKTSAGTGFRAPSLYELYDIYSGNDKLKPEKTFVYDAGVYQELFDGLFSLDCTYFVQRYRSMIDYNYSTSKYYNAGGEIINRGVEVASLIKIADIIKISYGYTYIDYVKTGGSTILKRPANKHSASVTCTPYSGFDITGTYLYVDQRYDYLTATTTVRLGSYQKFDMNIRYALNEMITFTFRGENLTDADYMETYGYNTKGRSFYGGAEIVL